MTAGSRGLLALDIGGANVKLAHSCGVVRSRQFALWREPKGLARVVAEEAGKLPPFEALLLTMTAELCDCFATKREGVRFVLDALAEAIPGKPIAVWGLDARFHPVEITRVQPALAAASNWLALATFAATQVATGTGLLIDVGSTTTDLIPFRDGVVAISGRTDTERLGSGELVYAGVRRTPVCALAASLPFRGRATGLCAELFATTHDVYLTLGSLPEDPDNLDTADGRPATAEGARDRLARMVGADREGFTADDAKALAKAADEALLLRLVESADRVCRTVGERPGTVVVSGSGEFLARRVGDRLVRTGGQTVELGSFWGAEGSTAACARALIELYMKHEDPNRARL